MMGNRGTRGGMEYDAFSRIRRLHGFRAGTIRWIKRQFWKRQRRLARRAISTWEA